VHDFEFNFSPGSPSKSFFNDIDPERTLAADCGNGFDAGFCPYQSARLSRYDAAL
jgi:hypothetical protein